jgi:hypothetical protein
MNMQILQWLLKNRDILLKVVELAKQFPKEGTYVEKWVVVDQIARLVIPVLEAELVRPHAVWHSEPESYEAYFAAGAEFAAMGVDWQLIVDVVIPILISILQAIAASK